MLLTPHILVGAAVASKFSNPLLGLLFAFLSHFLLDRIPHWEYSAEALKQIRTRGIRYCMPILLRVFMDVSLGFIILTLAVVFSTNRLSPEIVLIGGFFGALPDGLTFLLFIKRGSKNWIASLLRVIYLYHQKIHFNKKMGLPPLRIGLSTQAIAILVALYVIVFG